MKYNILLFFYILLPLISGEGINPFLRGQQPPHKVMVIAHRGASAYAPENTMCAFKKAIEIGAHMFELDVHTSKDGIVIVFHDDNLAKCTNVEEVFPDRAPYFISNFTYGELQKLDAGSWFIKKIEETHYLEDEKKYITPEDIKLYTSGQVKIPTLKEVLEFVKTKSCFVNIEIKSISQFYPNIAKKVVSLVEETDVVEQTIISSFDHYAIVSCKKYNPKIATAALCVERIFQPGAYCKMIGADAANMNMRILGFDSILFRSKGKIEIAAIVDTNDEGIAANIWTVNDPEQLKILISSGVSGIISDYPNRVLDALQNP